MSEKKQAWLTPELTHYGSVEEVTAGGGTDKNFNADDGFTLEGDSIGS